MATYTLFINNIPSVNTSNNKKILGNGNIVDLTLETPLELGEGNKYQMKLLTASIVYCEPNIKSANNKFRFKYGLDASFREYTIPTGLYTIEDFNKTLSDMTWSDRGNINVAYDITTKLRTLNVSLDSINKTNIFEFVADEATSHCRIFFKDANIQDLDCSGDDNVLTIFGFSKTNNGSNNIITPFEDMVIPSDHTSKDFTTLQSNLANGTVLEFFTSEFQAQLNSIQNILVKCNQAMGGSYYNENTDNILAIIQPDCEPFSTIYVKNPNPTVCRIPVHQIRNIRISLVNESNEDLDFFSESTDPNGELWSATIIIEPIPKLPITYDEMKKLIDYQTDKLEKLFLNKRLM